MAKLHKFSFDMYLIEYNGLIKEKFNTMPTTPLGVGYIETENKEVSVMDIYVHLTSTTFKEFNPGTVRHPFDYNAKTDIRVLKLDKYNHVIVNNIRKLY